MVVYVKDDILKYITIMFKFKELVQKIQEKQEKAFAAITKNIVDRTHRELNTSKSISDLKRAYLHDDITQINRSPSNNIRVHSPKTRAVQLQSENKVVHRHVRNTSSNPQLQSKDLQLKKEKLMIELKEIDLQMKSHHQDEYLQKIKRNRTESQVDKSSYERAAKLVQKMNKQRKDMADKKIKETLVLKQNVEESLRKFKELEQQKKQEMIRKKLQIQKRIQDRKLKAYERDRLNKMSNHLIKEIGSYKVSLPDIYLKIYQKKQDQQQTQVLLTNIQQPVTNSKGEGRYNRESRVSPFLENIHQEEIEKQKVNEQKKEYQKNVREKHLQFSRKMRIQQKLRIEKQKSKKRIPRTRVKKETPTLSQQKIEQPANQTLQ